MGQTASQRKRHSAVMSGRLSDFAAWTFSISCATCHHQRVLPVSDILVVYRGDILIRNMVTRLRCSTPGCGARPGRVVISNRQTEVLLIGVGAYG